MGVVAWPESIDPQSSDDFLKYAVDLKWGEIEDGRDRLGSRVLKIAREEKELFDGIDILREGVLQYGDLDSRDVEKGLMSPGFQLILITELEKWEPSEMLERLKLALRILAVEGQVEKLTEDLAGCDK